MPKCTVICGCRSVDKSTQEFVVTIQLEEVDGPAVTECFDDLAKVLNRVVFLGFPDIAVMYACGRLVTGYGHVVNGLEISEAKLSLVSPELLDRSETAAG
jgi:hypothetical protein